MKAKFKNRFNIIIENNNVKRAGVIPYRFNDKGEVEVYCMIPSDPAYGGSAPQLAKGKIDRGESAISTAWREGEEELGLKKSNIKDGKLELLGYFNYTGMDVGTDIMAVFYGEVIDENDWGQPHYETGWSGWVNLSTEFEKLRRNQQIYYKLLLTKI